MKILVVSLLRLGDFIQTVPVINGLARKPGVELDVLVHKPTLQLAPLVRNVRKWWSLDRDELQEGLGRADIPMMTSIHVLRETLDEVSATEYDLVINLTHTRFSGYLLGYIRAKEKLGMHVDEFNRVRFNSPWFRYLDRHAKNPVPDVLNYSDIFLQACGLEHADWEMRPTAQGMSELAALSLPDCGALIVGQTLTSDAKKNWSSQSWTQLFHELYVHDKNRHFVLLGAPSEQERLTDQIERLRLMGVPARLGIMSLDGALALLNRADLLITGDTSIKHLANASRARVVELSLGSSDFRRTGVFKSESLILASRAECAPCAHSSQCSQDTHLCGENLSPQLVAEACENFLKSDWSALTMAAQHGKFKAMRTRRLHSGMWLASDLSDQKSVVQGLLNRSTWKLLFNQEHRRPLAAIGSESVLIKEDLRELFPTSFGRFAGLDFIEQEIEEVRISSEHQLARSPIGIRPDSKTVSITEIREKQVDLGEKLELGEIKKKLIRSLKSQSMENL